MKPWIRHADGTVHVEIDYSFDGPPKSRKKPDLHAASISSALRGGCSCATIQARSSAAAVNDARLARLGIWRPFDAATTRKRGAETMAGEADRGC